MRTSLQRLCAERGLRAITLPNGGRALDAAHRPSLKLIVASASLSDVPLPLLCRTLRAGGFVGSILCVASSGRLESEIAALDAGADAFVAMKPVRRLLAHADATIRRASGAYSKPAQLGRLEIDVDRGDARVDREFVRLTPTEFALLLYLVENRHRIVTMSELFREVLGERGQQRQIVKRHISRLRAKLGPVATSVLTLRHRGYRFDAP